MNSLVIRLATIDDLDSVFELDQEFECDKYSKDMISDILSNPNSITLVAIVNDEIVSYCTFDTVLDEASLIKIVVTKNYRGSGIGYKLLEKSKVTLESNEVKSVYLEVRSSNNIAKKLYEKIGFNKIYSRQKYYSDGEDADIYRLSL